MQSQHAHFNNHSLAASAAASQGGAPQGWYFPLQNPHQHHHQQQQQYLPQQQQHPSVLTALPLTIPSTTNDDMRHLYPGQPSSSSSSSSPWTSISPASVSFPQRPFVRSSSISGTSTYEIHQHNVGQLPANATTMMTPAAAAAAAANTAMMQRSRSQSAQYHLVPASASVQPASAPMNHGQQQQQSQQLQFHLGSVGVGGPSSSRRPGSAMIHQRSVSMQVPPVAAAIVTPSSSSSLAAVTPRNNNKKNAGTRSRSVSRQPAASVSASVLEEEAEEDVQGQGQDVMVARSVNEPTNIGAQVGVLATPRGNKRRHVSSSLEPSAVATMAIALSDISPARPRATPRPLKTTTTAVAAGVVADADATPIKANFLRSQAAAVAGGIPSSPFPAPPISASSPAVGGASGNMMMMASDPEEMGRFLGHSRGASSTSTLQSVIEGETTTRGGRSAEETPSKPPPGAGVATTLSFDARLKNRLLGQGHDGGYLVSPLQDMTEKFAGPPPQFDEELDDDEEVNELGGGKARSKEPTSGRSQGAPSFSSMYGANDGAFAPRLDVSTSSSNGFSSWQDLAAKLAGDHGDPGMFVMTPANERAAMSFLQTPTPAPMSAPPVIRAPPVQTPAPSRSLAPAAPTIGVEPPSARRYPAGLGSGMPSSNRTNSNTSSSGSGSTSTAVTPTKKKRIASLAPKMARTASLQVPATSSREPSSEPEGPGASRGKKRARPVSASGIKSSSSSAPDASAFTTRPLASMPNRTISSSSTDTMASGPWEYPRSPHMEFHAPMPPQPPMPMNSHNSWNTIQQYDPRLIGHSRTISGVSGVSGITGYSTSIETPILMSSGGSPAFSGNGHSPMLTPSMGQVEPMYYGHGAAPAEYDQFVQVDKKFDGLALHTHPGHQQHLIPQAWPPMHSLPIEWPQHQQAPPYAMPAAPPQRHVSAYYMQEPPPHPPMPMMPQQMRSVSDGHIPAFNASFYGMSTIEEEDAYAPASKKPKVKHPIVGTRLKPGPRPKPRTATSDDGGRQRSKSASASGPHDRTEPMQTKIESAPADCQTFEDVSKQALLLPEPQMLDKSHLDQCYTSIMIPDEMNPILSVKRYQCTLNNCGRIFPRKSAVYSHIQTHLEYKPFVCREEDCDAAFVRHHDLKRHLRSHTGSKPYPCPCGKSFSRVDALTRHRQRQICIGGIAA